MTNTIVCPNCKTEFEPTEAMSAQLTAQIREELEVQYRSRRQELDKEADALRGEQAKLKQARETVDQQVEQKLSAQREQLEAEARKKAQADVAVELKDRDAQLEESRQKLQEVQDNELEMRKRERQLKERQEQLELLVDRKVEKERDKIRQDAIKQATEQHQLKDAEKDKKVSDLLKQINEMKRKAEQGSQQTQGEVLELALEELLKSAFPTDAIEQVPKGTRGGDIIQRVLTPNGENCGTILWESKRTKTWSPKWLAKLRQDQREAKATIAAIVSTTLPEKVSHFDQIEGIWISSWPCAASAAVALRACLLEAAKAKRAIVGQKSKRELVYNYLASPEFRHRVTGMAEALFTMRGDLEKEKQAIQRLWAKRDKQIDQAAISVAGMYGDLQGIIGATLPEIEGMELPKLEAKG